MNLGHLHALPEGDHVSTPKRAIASRATHPAIAAVLLAISIEAIPMSRLTYKVVNKISARAPRITSMATDRMSTS